MEHAVAEIVPESAERTVHMALLPAAMAEIALQARSAIEAGAAMAVRLAGMRLDGACGHAARHRLSDPARAVDHAPPPPARFIAQPALLVEGNRAGRRPMLFPRL
jgi:hypothetical protein